MKEQQETQYWDPSGLPKELTGNKKLSKTGIAELKVAIVGLGLTVVQVQKKRANSKTGVWTGYRVRHFKGTHCVKNRQESLLSSKEKVDKFCLKLCREHLDGSSGPQADNNESAEYFSIQDKVKQSGLSRSVEELLEIAIASEQAKQDLKQIQIEEAWEDWQFFYHKRNTVSASHRDSIRWVKNQLISPIASKCLSMMNELDWLDHFETTADRCGWSIKTYREKVKIVSQFIKFGMSPLRGWVDKRFNTDNLFERIPNAGSSFAQRRAQYFTREQIDMILNASCFDSHSSRSDYRTLNAANSWTGARLQELMCAVYDDINWEEKTITVLKTKGSGSGGWRTVDLHPAFYNYCDRNWMFRSEGPLVDKKVFSKYEKLLMEARECANENKEFPKIKNQKLSEQLMNAQKTVAQARSKYIARKVDFKWIKNGPRHSFGTHRYKIIKAGSTVESAKGLLADEMGTSVKLLSAHYVAEEKKLDRQMALDYFELG